MIWGMGTGRCGTKSLARFLGGEHEPQPWIRDEGIRAFFGEPVAVSQAKVKLKERLAAGVPCVDLKHSFLIKQIEELDANAAFVWVARDPVATVQSFLSGGSWTVVNQYGRDLWRPRHGWQNMESRIEKAAAHWWHTNMICLNHFRRHHDTRLILCDELPVRLNVYEDREALNVEQVKYVEHKCGDLWREILGCR